MNLVRWNPWKEMDVFSDRVHRLGSFFPSSLLSDEASIGNWRPAADIYEHEDKIVIKAELPGVDKKDIRVDVKENVLTLEGERSHEAEVKEEHYYRKERVHGTFRRSFSLPDGLDSDKIEANYKDGVLNIEIPRSEVKKAKKIAVH